MAETNLLISGRAQYNEPTPSDGDVLPLSMNDSGRLRVVSKPGAFPVSTAALSAVGNALTVDVSDSSNIVLHVKNSGTAVMSAGAFTFEGSIDSTNGTDGTWFAVQAVRSNANTIEGATGTLSLAVGAGAAYAWELSVNAIKWFRVRCTTAVTASSMAFWTAIRGSYATEPIPAVQTHAVTGSGTFTVSGSATTTPVAPTAYSLTTAATTNAAAVKTSAGSLFELTVFNSTAATIYVRLYNKASAPTVGTDIPILVFPVAAGALASLEFGALGKRFATGIALAVTAAAGNTDATVVTAGALISASYI